MRNVSLVEQVCESFYAENLSEALKSIEKLQNIGELRFDLSGIELDDLQQIISSTEKKLIFTCRTPKIKKIDAITAYQKAIDVGFQYIDIDFFVDGDILQQLHSLEKTQLIVSFHNYEQTPPKYELINILDELKTAHPNIVKLATQLKSKEDIHILEELQFYYRNAIIMGMGTWAVESRIKSIKAGAPFTYLALNPDQSTAKGQVGFQEFQESYLSYRGVEDIRLAVIGNPIAHSKSPELFQRFFKEDELQGIYEKMELENIREIEEVKKHFQGFNVTAPFKQSIIPHLDELSNSAEKIGAVNTVFQKDEKWIGDNTDYKGIIEAIRSRADLSKIHKCLILGAGGAARAAAYAMKQTNAACFVINRTHEKAIQLADDFDISAIEEAQLDNFQLIINTVPEPFSIIKPEELTSNHIVLDAIYPNSVFARYATESGFILIRGEVWLKEQAWEAYRIFRKNK